MGFFFWTDSEFETLKTWLDICWNFMGLFFHREWVWDPQWLAWYFLIFYGIYFSQGVSLRLSKPGLIFAEILWDFFFIVGEFETLKTWLNICWNFMESFFSQEVSLRSSKPGLIFANILWNFFFPQGVSLILWKSGLIFADTLWDLFSHRK